MTETEYLQRRLELVENLIGAVGSFLALVHPELHGGLHNVDAVWKSEIDKLDKEHTA